MYLWVSIQHCSQARLFLKDHIAYVAEQQKEGPLESALQQKLRAEPRVSWQDSWPCPAVDVFSAPASFKILHDLI